jgi:hypothetical protein
MVVTSYIALRSLVERIAHANRIAEALKDIQVAEDAIYEGGAQIVEVLYGTKQNWPALPAELTAQLSPIHFLLQYH